MSVGNSLLVYGPPKTGKTLAVHSAFPKCAAIMVDPGGLISVEAHLGRSPLYKYEMKGSEFEHPIDWTKSAIEMALKRVASKEVTAIVLDTGSTLAQLIEDQLSAKIKDGRQLHPAIRREFTRLINLLLFNASPAWVIMICHESPPRYEKIGDYRILDERGGPGLPRKLVEHIPGLFSIVLRTRVVGGQFMMFCNPADSEWVMGDRYGGFPREAPLDLRPALWRARMGDNPLPPFPPLVIKRPEGSTGDPGGLPL